MKIDWKAKLSSRKFWALITGVVVSVMVLLGADATSQDQVVGVIGAVGSVAVYIIGESIVDASRNKE
jgi:hypothetical protein